MLQLGVGSPHCESILQATQAPEKQYGVPPGQVGSLEPSWKFCWTVQEPAAQAEANLHGDAAGHVFGVPVHVPLWHESDTVQAFPSSHVVAL